MRPASKIIRGLALTAVLAALSGCAEYLDRRDTIALSAGDAVATDKVAQMVDPWPRASAEKNIAFNGAKMESAMERYRTNRVYPPSGTGTSSAYQPSANSGNNAPVASAVAQPVAPPPPVK
jgi:hypothetical protein